MKKFNKLLATASVFGVLASANNAMADYTLTTDAIINANKLSGTGIQSNGVDVANNEAVNTGNIDLGGFELTFMGDNTAHKYYNITDTSTGAKGGISIDDAQGSVSVYLTGIEDGIRTNLNNSTNVDTFYMQGTVNNFYLDIFNIRTDNISVGNVDDNTEVATLHKASFGGTSGTVIFYYADITTTGAFEFIGGVNPSFTQPNTTVTATSVLFDGMTTMPNNIVNLVSITSNGTGVDDGITFSGGTATSQLDYKFTGLTELNAGGKTVTIGDYTTLTAATAGLDVTASGLTLKTNSIISVAIGNTGPVNLGNGSVLKVTGDDTEVTLGVVTGTGSIEFSNDFAIANNITAGEVKFTGTTAAQTLDVGAYKVAALITNSNTTTDGLTVGVNRATGVTTGALGNITGNIGAQDAPVNNLILGITTAGVDSSVGGAEADITTATPTNAGTDALAVYDAARVITTNIADLVNAANSKATELNLSDPVSVGTIANTAYNTWVSVGKTEAEALAIAARVAGIVAGGDSSATGTIFSAPEIHTKNFTVNLGGAASQVYAVAGKVNFDTAATVNILQNTCTLYFGDTVIGTDGTTKKTMTVAGAGTGGVIFFAKDATLDITNGGVARTFKFADGVKYEGKIADSTVGGSTVEFQGGGTFKGELSGKALVPEDTLLGTPAVLAVPASFDISGVGSTLNVEGTLTDANVNHNASTTVKLTGNFTVGGNYSVAAADEGAVIDSSLENAVLTVSGNLNLNNNLKVIISAVETNDLAIAGKLVPAAGKKITLSTGTLKNSLPQIFEACAVTATETINVLSFGLGVDGTGDELKDYVVAEDGSWIKDKFGATFTTVTPVVEGLITITPVFANNTTTGAQSLSFTYARASAVTKFADLETKMTNGFEYASKLFTATDDDTLNTSKNALFFINELAKLTTADEQASVMSSTVTPTQNAASVVVASAVVGNTMQSALNAADARITAAAAAGDNDRYLGGWISPFLGRSTQKAVGSNPGYKSDSQGGTIGFDTKLDDNIMLGLAASMGNSKMKLKDQSSGDTITSRSIFASLYGSYYFDNSWELEGLASVGRTSVKNKRVAIGGSTASCNYKHTSFFGRVLGGYKYGISDAFSVTPLAGVSYRYISSDKATETGATSGNRSINIGSISKSSLVGGFRTTYATRAMEDAKLMLGLHAFVNYDMDKKVPKMSVKVEDYDQSIASYSNSSSRVGYNIGADATMKYDSVEYGVGYECNLAKKFVGHQGSLKLKLNF